MADKKELPLAVAKILKEYTDEEHLLTTKEMIEILEEEYGLTAERRTIYANIELLKRYGYDISTWQENGEGYYLKTHYFSPEEISWFISKIKAEDAFPRKKKKELTDKLRRMLSRYQKV